MQGKITSIEIGSNEHGEYKKAKVETADGTKTVYVSPKVKNIYNGVEPGKVVTLKAKNNGNGFLIAGFASAATAASQAPVQAWDTLPSKNIAAKTEKAVKVWAYAYKQAQGQSLDKDEAIAAATAALNLLR